MKIGIQTLAYNCHEVIEDVLRPWINLKDKYDVKVWVGSGQFKIYKDLGYEDKNSDTLQVLNRMLERGDIDYVFTPDPENLLSDHKTRNMCIPYFKENDIDLMVQVDSDEFYTDEEVNNFIKFIEEYPDHTCFNTTFKNLIGNGTIYEEWTRFSAARIKNHGGISHYYFDSHWSFEGEDGNNIEYRRVPIITTPKELVHPIHDTWTNNRKGSGTEHIKGKMEYQKKYYSHDCGWIWDEEEQTVKPNEKLWGDNIPNIKNISR